MEPGEPTVAETVPMVQKVVGRGEHHAAIRDAGMLSVVGVVVGLGNLAFNVIVARIAGTEAYGALGSLLALSTVAAFLVVGVQYAVARRVAIGVTHPADLLHVSMRTAARWLAIMLVLSGLAAPLAVYLHLGSPLPALLTVILVGVMSVGAVPMGVATGLRLFGAIAICQLASVFVRLSAGVGLAAVFDPTIAALLATIAASLGLGGSLLLVVLRRPDTALPARVEPVADSQHIVVEGGLGAVASAGLWTLWSLPLLFARHGLGAAAAGNFAAVQILGSAILFVCTPMITVFHPAIARARNRRMVIVGMTVTATVSTAGVVGLTLLGPSVLHSVYGGGYGASRSLFLALSGSAAAVAMVTYGFWILRALDALFVATGLGIGAALVVTVLLGGLGPASAVLFGVTPVLGSAAGAVVVLATVISRSVRRRTVDDPPGFWHSPSPEGADA